MKPIGKARQKNVSKECSHINAKTCGERLFNDISTINIEVNEVKVKTNWLIVVDERSQMKFTAFYNQKSDIESELCRKLLVGSSKK